MQNYLNLINQLSGKKKTKGDTISFQYCPFCNGGEHNDKYTFAINSQTGAYNCLRGSCRQHGHIIKLAKQKHLYIEQGEYMKTTRFVPTPKKNYIKPKSKAIGVNSDIYEYFEERGISSKIVEFAGIEMSTNKWIVYNGYDENNNLCYRKFKNYKTNNKQNRFKAEQGGKQIFFLQNKVKTDENDTLIITEGEEDCLSLYEIGFDNAVSLPFGANSLNCISNSWDWLQKFTKVIIWTDNDDAGRKSLHEINERLKDTHEVLFVEGDNFKDANEILQKANNSFETIESMVGNAEYFEKDGMISLSEIEQVDYSKLENIKSSLDFINRNTQGGYRFGEVVLWTGYQGSGKSTLLSQEITFAISQNEMVGVYSSETSHSQFVDVLFKQWAGNKDLEVVTRYDEHNVSFNINQDVFDELKNTIGNSVKIVSEDFYGDYNKLFSMFTKARRRYGIKIFIIDNLMTLLPHNENIYQTQTQFFIEAQKLVKYLGITLHIVAHHRKPM
ncbi:MAG: bifunctional DNA primase/helicase [Candidatus Cloacimonadota bacterium]|nr:bifunctional DNA primase/helicase [Candidatus Cloacimonadota bacterium]